MEDLPEAIASLKITEAISILRAIDGGIDSVLANVEEN
jgi:AraC family transcriptional regulator, exoenzyme S synthesis regulatory protein ExsA